MKNVGVAGELRKSVGHAVFTKWRRKLLGKCGGGMGWQGAGGGGRWPESRCGGGSGVPVSNGSWAIGILDQLS